MFISPERRLILISPDRNPPNRAIFPSVNENPNVKDRVFHFLYHLPFLPLSQWSGHSGQVSTVSLNYICLAINNNNKKYLSDTCQNKNNLAKEMFLLRILGGGGMFEIRTLQWIWKWYGGPFGMVSDASRLIKIHHLLSFSGSHPCLKEPLKHSSSPNNMSMWLLCFQ